MGGMEVAPAILISIPLARGKSQMFRDCILGLFVCACALASQCERLDAWRMLNMQEGRFMRLLQRQNAGQAKTSLLTINSMLQCRPEMNYLYSDVEFTNLLVVYPLFCEVALVFQVQDETVVRAKAGDPQAIRQLVEVFDSRLKAICCANCGWDAGEEVAQNIWIEKLSKIKQFEGDTVEEFKRFLLRDVRGRCIDQFRKKSRLHIQLPIDDDGRAMEVPDAAPLSSEDLSIQELWKTKIEKVKKCLAEHETDDSIRILRMRFFDGYSVNKIAELLGMDNKNGGVSKKLKRELSQLEKCVRGVQQ